MTLKIISADNVLFSGEVSAVKLPGVMGEFTVLDHHATLVAALTAGKVRYVVGNRFAEAGVRDEHTLEIGGGVADVDNNTVSVCIY